MDKTEVAKKILYYALPEVPFEGWSQSVIKNASIKAGLEPEAWVRYFPNGVVDLINFWMKENDELLSNKAVTISLNNLKIRERIKTLVKLRIELYTNHREAIRKICAMFMLPWHMAQGAQTLGRTVDIIWKLAGDQSHDFNWYSKRVLLAGVYSSTLLYWLDDTSEDHSATWEFLDRRIENVLSLGKKMPFNKQKK